MEHNFDIRFSYNGIHYKGKVTNIAIGSDNHYKVNYTIAGVEDETFEFLIEMGEIDEAFFNPEWKQRRRSGDIGIEDEMITLIGEKIEDHCE